MRDGEVELVLGLEVHVRLDTGGKLFCTCRLPYDRTRLQPNSAICAICTGHPGSMPHLQESGVLYGLALALALGALPDDLRGVSRFERKHYFFWDLPKNYQITQIESPLCPRTLVRFQMRDKEEPIEVFLTRIHLEEDAASKQEDSREIRVDFNRSGTVLAEIVTEPGFRTSEDAAQFLHHLRRTLQWHNLGSGEVADLRCDVNMSVRWKGEDKLNPKVEIKNLTTIEGMTTIIRHEQERLAQILRAGGEFSQETREWDPEKQDTRILRQKESASEYWYYVEPDLLDVEITERHLEGSRELLRPPVEKVVEEMRQVGFSDEEIFGAVLADPDAGFPLFYLTSRGLSVSECRTFADCLRLIARQLYQDRTPQQEQLESLRLDTANPAWLSRIDSFSFLWQVLRPNLDLLATAVKEGTVNQSHLVVLAEKRALTRRAWSSLDELLREHGLERARSGDALETQVRELLAEILAAHPGQCDLWLKEGDRKLSNFFQGQLMQRLPKGTHGGMVFQILQRYRQSVEQTR